jgi:cation diffusion facilitator CzcD-associated flavoprotein CzcO
MRFSCQKFPEDSRLFPERYMIEDYLVKYAQDVRHLVHFSKRVNRVSLTPRDGVDNWEVETEDTITGDLAKDTFDAVVVANGHYSTPYLPNIKHIKEFNEAYPGVITHSKQYRTPYTFSDQKVVVVGNGPSGLDIALQINQHCIKPARMSVRHPTSPERLAHAGCKEVAEIEEFLIEEKGVRLKDGRVESDVGAVVFCTGFLCSLPFLDDDLQHKLITSGRGVNGLYQHIFCIEHPTLVFPSLNMKAAPWPLSESQAAVISAIWSNNLQLPPREEMETWSKKLLQEQGDALHVFKPLGDGHYINALHDWVMTADKPAKEPPRWDDELMWQRSIFLEAKTRFEKTGCTAQTLEELGYHYKPGWADEEKDEMKD